jgi:hypothetical protein
MLSEDLAVEEFKKHLARFPPPIIHNNICIQHGLCKDAYAVQWWMRVDRGLLDPSDEVLAKLLIMEGFELV